MFKLFSINNIINIIIDFAYRNRSKTLKNGVFNQISYINAQKATVILVGSELL